MSHTSSHSDPKRTRDFATALAPHLQACAVALTRAANKKFPDRPWLKIYSDRRFFNLESRSSTAGGGVLFADGSKTQKFVDPSEMAQIMFADVGALRQQFADVAWYGILFLIDNQGNVEIRYDYDPACHERIDEDRNAWKQFE